MKTEKIGIDLGTHTIKMVVTENLSEVYKIKYAKNYRVKTGENYYKFLKECIQDFTKENKIKIAKLYFSIAHNNKEVNVEIIKMPIVDTKILKRSIKYEIEEKEIIKDINSVYYSWEILNEEQENEYEIIIATIEKTIVKELTSLKSVTWKIENIEIQPITVGRILKGDSIVIDFGNSGTKIYMYKNSKLDKIEFVKFGGVEVTNIIKKSGHEYTDEEVEDIKRMCYISNEFIEIERPDDITEYSKNITKIVEQTTDDIKRIIRSFELKNSIIIDSIHYIGESSNMVYFIDYFSKEIEVDIKPLELLIPRDDNEAQKDLKMYTLAASSTMNSEYKYFNELNFITFAKFSIDLTPILIGIICVLLATNIASYKLHKKYDEYYKSLGNIESNQNKTISELDTKINDYTETETRGIRIVETIQKIINEKKWISDILFILPEKTPYETIITNINIRYGTVVLNGYSKNYSDIGFLAIELEEIGEVNIDYIEDIVDSNKYTTENISLVSNITKEFQITLKYGGDLTSHETVEID